MSESISAAQFVAAVRTWVGVPWHHQGRNRHGVDCAGLPEAVLREAGVLPAGYRSPRRYGRLPHADLGAMLERWCTPVAEAQPGVLILIAWRPDARPSHVAVHAGRTMIHAYRETRAVVEHAYSGQWLRRTVGYWRAPGVSYE